MLDLIAILKDTNRTRRNNDIEAVDSDDNLVLTKEENRGLDNSIASKFDELAFDEAGVPTEEQILEQLLTGRAPLQPKPDPIYSTLFTCDFDGMVCRNNKETSEQKAAYDAAGVPSVEELKRRMI